MPLLLEGRVSRSDASGPTGSGQDRRRLNRQWRPCLEIGLVNNMPDAAMRATEEQFCALLDAATGDRVVRLHLFSLPAIPRGAGAKARIRSRYTNIHELRSGELDALIVTGCEPKAKSLAEEPYWAAFTDLVDWAEHNTISTIWSCLAAHAAVLHLDGISRTPLPSKRFGLFDCVKMVDNPLTRGMAEQIKVPHSRWNDVAEADLRAHGYKVLTRSGEAGADLFTKQWGSLFVFFQGHPEYNIDTLFREYRRDLTRFMRAERDTPPDLPANYFDDDTIRAFSSFAQAAQECRSPQAVVKLPSDWAVEPASIAAWRSPAVQIYRNWIEHVANVKCDRG